MGIYTGTIQNQGNLFFRDYEQPTIEPDPLNIGLVKIRFVVAKLKLEVTSFDSTKIWRAIGNPTEYRFGKLALSYYGSVGRKGFLNFQRQTVEELALFMPLEYFSVPEAQGGISFSLPYGIVRSDELLYDLEESVQCTFTLILLKSAEFSGVEGFI